ncbi:MAG: geranylgeranyl reductase family protein [Calditrichaeota bacterium]|nr:geranylgeranyl reductase family protein [Calditrichota bacterium]
MIDYDYDVAIVGAGPAGTTTALYAARAGLKVVLIDKKKFPRDKICGDAISGKSITYLRELGLLDKLQQIPHKVVYGVIFSSPNTSSIKIYFQPNKDNGDLHGFICRRIEFDNLLFQTAKKEMDTLEESPVEDLILENDQVIGVRIKRDTGETLDITARVVVGADGFSSVVARKLGIYELDPDHHLVATRAYYRGVTGMDDSIELHYIKDILPGYFWIFPADNGLANVGLGMVHSKLKKKGIRLRQAHEAATRHPFFRERFENAELMDDIQGWNLPVGSKRRRVHGNGFLLVGDAAGLIDPFTGEGIGNAMCSGKIAAQVLTEVCAGKDYSANALQEYPRRLWERLGPELHLAYQLQRVGRIWPLINLVVSKAQRNEEVKQWIANMMAGNVPKSELTNPFTYLKLLFK